MSTQDKEREDFIAWVRAHEGTHGALDEGSAWAAWQAARRAPAVPVPKGWKLAPEIPTQSMCDAGKYQVHAGLSVFKWADGYSAMLAAAPQPPEVLKRENPATKPEAAPVQLPDPVAFALEWTFNGEERGIRLYDDETHCRFDAASDGGICSPLYTEQQVRQLLAAHGIKEQST